MLDSIKLQIDTTQFYNMLAFKQYELTNHLGNVLATVSDRKTPVGSGVDYFKADVINANYYYPFGSSLKSWNSDTTYKYKYQFNGKEVDKEGLGGGGWTYDYGFRIYNAQLGKFLSVDPLTSSYPWYTPYQFAGNKPIVAIDLDGLEEFFVHEYTLRNSFGQEFLYRVDFVKVYASSKVDNTPNTVAVKLRMKFNKRAADANMYLFNNYNKASAQNAKDRGLIIDYSGILIRTLKNHPGHNFPPKTDIVLPKVTVIFGPDKGKTMDEVKQEFEKATNNIVLVGLDNLATSLVNDPTLKVDVKGYASDSPTNIEGTEEETTEQNNQKLAQQRADAGKAYLLNYIRTVLGVQDFDESRIKAVNGGVGTTGSGDNSNQNQAIVIVPIQ